MSLRRSTPSDKGDIVISVDGTVWTVKPAVIAAGISLHTDKLLGRDTAGTGSAEEISVGGGLEFTGSAGIQRSALTGDATASAGSNALTIAAGVVTNAKLATVATATIKGRTTAGTGAPEDLTAAQVKSLLAIAAGDVSGLAMVATSGSASDLGTGTLPAGRLPALTGDVTSSAGSAATTIANDAVTNAKLANVATATIKGRTSASTGDPEDLTASQVKTLLAIAAGDVSGLATVATSGSASDLSTGTLAAGRLPAHTGDVTSSAGSAALTIANKAVTLAKMDDMATASFLGRNTAGTGAPEVLSATTATALLNVMTTSLKGLVPAPGNTTYKFLRDDATFVAPSHFMQWGASGISTGTDNTKFLIPGGANGGATTVQCPCVAPWDGQIVRVRWTVRGLDGTGGTVNVRLLLGGVDSGYLFSAPVNTASNTTTEDTASPLPVSVTKGVGMMWRLETTSLTGTYQGFCLCVEFLRTST